MSKKNKKQSDGAGPSRSTKKAIVMGQQKPSHKKTLIIVGALLLVAAAAATAFFGLRSQDSVAVATPPAETPHATVVTYPADMFEDGRARHFEHTAGDLTIRYFILKSADGVIRAAFDACDVCWPANKGYFQDGDTMVCRNCGRRFASVRVNEVKGGCNPAPLKRRVEDGKLVIRIDDILEGRQYFNFS